MQLNEAIKKRHSVRKFKSKKPDWRDIIECIDAMRYAPMAGGNFTLKIILVQDKDKIQKIADACQQDFVGQAHYIVVVCSSPRRPENLYKEQGEKYFRQQAGAAIENFLLSIEEKGLAACWVGHFVEDIVKSILKIPEDICVEAIFPIGYELRMAKIATRKAKTDIDQILYFDRYDNKKMKNPKTIDA